MGDVVSEQIWNYVFLCQIMLSASFFVLSIHVIFI
jgi:hypothetical protein